MAARGLGKGLDSLIPDAVGPSKGNEKEKIKPQSPDSVVDINMVEPNRDQPRKKFDENALLELAESIKQYGLLQPILVQDRKTYYEIIAGERRWRAAKLAGLKKVPVIIRNLTEQELPYGNIDKHLEEALAYKKLLTEFNLKQEEVAERVSKSRTAVTNSMRLLKLCDDVQKMVVEDKLSTGHARAILSIEDPEEQFTLAKKIYDEKMSVRDVEKYIKNMNKPVKPKKEENKSLSVIYQDVEDKLKSSLGTKVSVSSKDGNGSGKIEIEFYTHDDLDRIIEILMK